MSTSLSPKHELGQSSWLYLLIHWLLLKSLLHTEVLSQERIIPPSTGEIKTVPLSILDCTVVRFSITSAAWIYDPPVSQAAKQAADPSHLVASFKQTIVSYPQWAGQLGWSAYDPTNSSGHTHRHGRVVLRYGAGEQEGDPGFAFCVARHSAKVSDIVPSPAARAQDGNGIWQIDKQLPSKDLLPREAVSWQGDTRFEGLPGVAVQVTLFADRGYAVAMKISHVLGDATTLLTFMHDWAATNRAMAAGTTLLPKTQPVFDPSLLDGKAAGDINACEPDLEIIRKARNLPLHRYDWFRSGGPDCPSYFLPSTVRPPDLQAAFPEPPHTPGPPIPWKEWDLSVPVKHSIIYFSPNEIQQIHAQASFKVLSDQQPQQRLSKLDALLAHVWACILRARQLHVDETAFLDITFSFRARLGLPSSFLGSPIRLAAVEASAAAAHANDLPALARRIRTTLGLFDGAQACAGILHDLAHEPNAQNIWATFLGRRHTLVTSWTHLGLYDVDFTGRQAPRYVDAAMPSCDGLLQVSESAPLDGVARSEAGKGDWARDGASVSLHLTGDVMERLWKDPLLRSYA
ncbi:hypothetical protein QFC21_005552 [Naganishia friedmannii]|uniref:Uncharacterized protein n=1 Tax=Naganishia friedmannii TaxID=89922 RepID=A0ACC2V8J6_9TREE|nr:hypothetical protein QFC21_005552 [Naganishia friedmannii]